MAKARFLLSAMSRWLVPGTVIIVPLVVLPTLEQPFTAPKTAALGVIGALLTVRAVAAPVSPAARIPRWLAGAWVMTLALSALFGAVAVPEGLWLGAAIGLVLMALLQAPPERDPTFRAIAVAGSLVAAVTALQLLGLDPFALAGWHPDLQGERMRVYGTLGNPDFVAAFLGATLCVTLGAAASAHLMPHRAVWIGACVLQLAAIAASRSWATFFALGAAGLGFAISEFLTGRRPVRMARRRIWIAAIVAVAGLAIIAPWGRSLGSALEGRLYLFKVAAPHIAERPLFGHGPGSVEILWPAWEAAYWASGSAETERRFIAVQDHLHNDYLEWLIELGAAGTLPRVLLLAAALLAAWRARGLQGLAAAAALTTLCARALVDFPLSRPAELYLAAILVTLSLQDRGRS